MSLHDASPVPAAVYIQDRLTSDSGRIEQDFSTLNGHASCCFRKPLIPADADADGSETCFKDLESRIPGSEIEFFLIKMVVRDMSLAVNAKNGSVCINHGNRVEQALNIPFIKADRNHDSKFYGNGLKAPDGGIFCQGHGIIIIIVSLFLTKIRSFKQFRKKDEIGSVGSGFTDQSLCFVYIFLYLTAARKLQCGNFYISHNLFPLFFAGICWVIQ